MAPRVDEKDLRILEILEKDARAPWRRIAKELGVSEATVYLRIKKLTEAGILKGFTVKVDHAALGLPAAAFLLVRAEAKSIPRVRSQLTRVRYVSEVYEVSGQYHFLVKVTTPSLDDISRTSEEIMGLDGVVEVLTFTVLRVVKQGAGIVEDYIRWTREG